MLSHSDMNTIYILTVLDEADSGYSVCLCGHKFRRGVDRNVCRSDAYVSATGWPS